MTQHIQSALARLFAGEAISPADPGIRDLLAEIRSIVRDHHAQRELGLLTLELLNAHLSSMVLTAKALHTAKGASHG